MIHVCYANNNPPFHDMPLHEDEVPNHEMLNLSRDMVRDVFGHSPDPLFWPRRYSKNGINWKSDEPVLTSGELPSVNVESLDDLEVLGELMLEAIEKAETIEEFDAIINSIEEL